MFKLDRTQGKGHTHEEAAKQQADYWKSETVEERLEAVFYLNSIAYGYDVNDPPKMDKTVFSTRKHENR